MNPREAAKNLETPPGIDALGDSGLITNMTARRKEMLDRLKKEPNEFPPTPPDQASQPDERNRAAYEEERSFEREFTHPEEQPGGGAG